MGSTTIFFDFRGEYSKVENEIRWIGRDDEFGIIVVPVETITYSELIDEILNYVGEDIGNKRLKLSYLPVVNGPVKPVYIKNDKTVHRHLIHVRDKACVLHVEVLEHESCGIEPMSRENEEFISSERDNCDMVENVGTVTVYTGEPFGMNEQMENVENGYAEDVMNGGPHDEDTAFLDREVDHTAWGEVADIVPNREWDDGLDLTLGQEFESKKEVQSFVYTAAHLSCFEVAIINSDKKLFVVKCRGVVAGCKWHLRVAKLKHSDRFSVRTYTKFHTCTRGETSMSTRQRRCTPRMVASVIHDIYPGTFDTPNATSIRETVERKLGMKMSYHTAWRGRNLAVSDIRGSPEESFKLLHPYLYMLQKTNEGTISRVEVDEDNKFKYLFVALGASIEGFRVMRKVIIVDGTFLKNGLGGVLIIATAQDPNHHHYPLAFGVVDAEKQESWHWFLSLLKTVIPDSSELVFVSDRHKGIISSVANVYPLSKHGFCIYHLSQNVKLHAAKNVNKDEVSKRFRECALAYSEVKFKTLLARFKETYPSAGAYVGKVDEKKWAKCYFPGERYNIDTTNCAESMNAVLLKARKYSLLPMLDVIVGKVSEWYNRHRNTTATVPSARKLVPYVDLELHTRYKEAKLLKVHELNRFQREYSVIGRTGKVYVVDLVRKTCACKHFDIDQYPCVHAIAAAIFRNDEEVTLVDLCSRYYRMELWALAYTRTIFPVPHHSHWDIPQEVQDMCVLPPDSIKTPGRNRETRYPSVGERRGRTSKSRTGSMYSYLAESSEEEG